MNAHLRRLSLLLCGALVTSAAAQNPSLTLTNPASANVASFRFGDAVSGIPDVNGDGRGDVVVGSLDVIVGQTGAGRVSVFSGVTGGALQTLLSPHPIFFGAFGGAVAGIPDVNGDGRGDVLVGAPGETVGTTTGAGRAYLFSGSTGLLLRSLTSTAPETNGSFGRSVAGVPDATGDGVPDLLVGAPEEDVDQSTDAGRVYLFSGATGAFVRSFRNPDDFRVSFGWSVAGVPDANGDGRGDVLVGAPKVSVLNTQSVGKAYLLSGASGAALQIFSDPDPHRFGGFGYSVAAHTGDAVGTVLIGKPGGSAGRADFYGNGRAYLFSTEFGIEIRRYDSRLPFELSGFGRSVAAVPDADGDGATDWLIGAPTEAIGPGQAGRAYLYAGYPNYPWLLRTLDSPAASSASRQMSVAGVPDANGDGLGDVAIGTPEEDGIRGRAYQFNTTTMPLALAGVEGWRLLSVPLAGSLSDLLAEIWTQGAVGADVPTGAPTVYEYYEPAVGALDVGYRLVPNLVLSPEAGTGYFVYVYDDDDPLTPGTQGGFPKALAVNGHTRVGQDIPFPVSFSTYGSPNADDNGWNLVGNPYPRSLNWDDPAWQKLNMSNAIYVFDRQTNAYRTWNGTTGSLGSGIVARSQGFWVKALSYPPTLVAPASAAVFVGAPVQPRGTLSAAPASLGLRLSGEVGDQPVEADAFVAFLDGASDAADDPFDAYELSPFAETFAALYFDAGGTLLDIEARAPLSGAAEFALGAAAAADGQPAGGAFTLTWPGLAALPSTWQVALTDFQTGETLDLRQQDAYPFVLGAGPAPARLPASSPLAPPLPTPLAFERVEGLAPPARFLLRVVVGVVGTDPTAPVVLGLDAAPNPTGGQTRLTYTLPAATDVQLVVLDALGREVAVVSEGPRPEGRHEAVVDSGRLAPGVYLVRLTAGSERIVRRLTVVPASR